MASVYWDHVQYCAHIPATYLDEMVLELVWTFVDTGVMVECTEHGVYFDCFFDYLHEVNERSWRAGDNAEYYSLNTEFREPSVCASRLSRLIKQSRVSLVYVEKCYCDSGGGYDDEPEPQNEDYWERQLENCPALILREVLAKRSE